MPMSTGKGSLAAVQMAVEDFGGKVQGQADRGGLRRPPEQAGYRRQHRAQLVSTTRRSTSIARRAHLLGGAARSSTLIREKNKICINSGAGSSDITGKACSPNTVHCTYDTYALSNVAGKAMVKRGEDTWFFITADYAFGHALERDAADVVKESGGKVLGDVRHPLNTSDFSSFLLQAQASKAKVVGARQCRRRHHQRAEAGRRIRPDRRAARS